MKTDKELIKWALEESPEPIIQNPFLKLALRSTIPPMEVLPEEFDELSPREEEYYKEPPFSTRKEYQKGQLVQPGQPGVRQGYATQEGAEKTAKIRIKKSLDTYRPIDPATSKPFTLEEWTDIGSKKRYRITSEIKGVEVDVPYSELSREQKDRRNLLSKKRYHMHPDIRKAAIERAQNYYWKMGGSKGKYIKEEDVFGKGILREEKNRL